MIYKQAQIDSFLKKNDPSIKAFLLYGPNEGLVAEYCKKLALTICPNLNDPFSVAYFNWDDIKNDTGLLSAEYNSQSLMGDRRVIILRDADNNLTKPLSEIITSGTSDTLLIICGNSNLNKKSSLVSFADNTSSIASFACYEDRDKDVSSSARAYLIEQGITFSNEAFMLLCSRLSNDRKFNINELEKLITYVGSKKHFATDDVRAIVFDQAVSGLDELCFHTFSGSKQKALNSLKYLLSEDVDEIAITRALIRHTNKLLEGKSLMENGETSASAIKKILPRNAFNFYDAGSAQLNSWSKQRLFDVMELLYKTERDCKTTNIPPTEALSYTVLTLLSAAAKLRN